MGELCSRFSSINSGLVVGSCQPCMQHAVTQKIAPCYWQWPVTWAMQGRSRVTINCWCNCHFPNFWDANVNYWVLWQISWAIKYAGFFAVYYCRGYVNNSSWRTYEIYSPSKFFRCLSSHDCRRISSEVNLNIDNVHRYHTTTKHNISRTIMSTSYMYMQ